MAIRQIREIGDELLRKKSRPYEKVDDKARELLQDLYDTLKQTDDGVGLAAPQVGVLRRAIVVDLSMDEENPQGPFKLINPVIVKKSGSQVCREGCLSIPGKLGDVERPKKVTVEALDENGKKITIKADGLLAVVLCHEIDHLDGVLFVDRATELFNAEDVENEENESK
ncbi:MAG: peptide deformylase [Clostridia bacterium]|jgi:peptide deformylase|nr:peptide deformylase [Clostridia bacterium]